MDKELVKRKFGNYFFANELTYKMGIDIRFMEHFASRLKGYCVLETCSGGGFSTISLSKYAEHVYSFEIDKDRHLDSIKNSEIANTKDNITFINDSILNINKYNISNRINAAFIDPDWAVTGQKHTFKFIKSNTNPPSDELFKQIYEITKNIILIQPPFVPKDEYNSLPLHEFEYLYLNNNLELYCLYFGDAIKNIGETKFNA